MVEEREADDAINLPLFEGYLVLDPRSDHDRAADAVESVAGAIACTAEDIHSVGWEGWFARTSSDFSHDRHSPAVILGGDVALAHSLAAFITSCSSRDSTKSSTS